MGAARAGHTPPPQPPTTPAHAHPREPRIPMRRGERSCISPPRPALARTPTRETYAFQCVGEWLIQPALTRSPPPPAHFLTARLPGRSPSSADDQGHIRDGLLEGCGPLLRGGFSPIHRFTIQSKNGRRISRLGGLMRHKRVGEPVVGDELFEAFLSCVPRVQPMNRRVGGAPGGYALLMGRLPTTPGM